MVQKLYASALRGAVLDDPLGYGTMFPADQPELPDLSTTPNRLLQSRVLDQATLRPGAFMVSPGSEGAHEVVLTLTRRPVAPVLVNATADTAWDDLPLALVEPASVVLQPEDFDAGGGSGNASATFVVAPRGVSEGDYFARFTFA